VIIIDDCSKDNTVKVIEEYCANKENVKLYRNKSNVGVAETRNIGFKMAGGNYIALIDADDLWKPNKLELQINMIQKCDVDIVYTSYELIDDKSNLMGYLYEVVPVVSYKDILKENCIGCSSVMFKREISDRIAMDKRYAHEDFAFWLECLRKGYKAAGINEPLMQYRVMRGTRSFNKIRALRNRFKILKEREKLPYLRSLYYIMRYSINGLKKYNKLLLKFRKE
jgi:teichuronic acid biosynthesis glycosyltransferase TuaG